VGGQRDLADLNRDWPGVGEEVTAADGAAGLLGHDNSFVARKALPIPGLDLLLSTAPAGGQGAGGGHLMPATFFSASAAAARTSSGSCGSRNACRSAGSTALGKNWPRSPSDCTAATRTYTSGSLRASCSGSRA